MGMSLYEDYSLQHFDSIPAEHNFTKATEIWLLKLCGLTL